MLSYICDPFVVGCLLVTALSFGFSLGAAYVFRQQDKYSPGESGRARKI